jgi:predicted SAM-dependent methyltransferase
MSVTLRLNIGSGPVQIPGFINWDAKDGANAFPLPFEKGTLDEIRASHVVEHLTFREVNEAFADWNRALVDGGEVRIAVPDFDKAAAMTDNPLRLRYVMGGQTDEFDQHKSAFTRESLTATLERFGFEVVGDWESEIQDCATLPVSLNLKARKVRSYIPKMVCIMNVPRVGFNLHFACVHKALQPLGIPIKTSMGVYWAQCMTRGLESAIKDGYEWALCVDYDSVFTQWHVGILLQTILAYPDVDALAPLQPQRHTDKVMFSTFDKGKEHTMSTHDPIRVHTAHFGLTLIRLAALKDVAKPWFIDRPDANGGFDDGRVDADVNFWHRWNEAGKNLSVLAGCSIGHLEGKVTHFNVATNQIECDYVGDYLKKHEAWGAPECIIR